MRQVRSAATTDYKHLYSNGYYAHAPGTASFDVERLPPIVARLAAESGHAAADIGGGNGVLGERLAVLGVNSVTLDIQDRAVPGFLRFDLASHDDAAAGHTRRRIAEALGDVYLATCFDVAEHIDVEHLADFVLNLRALVHRQLLISISTRPSSSANRYHASIFPIETWCRLFALAGFECEPFAGLQSFRSAHRFLSADQGLLAVSYWQRRNPFREDHASHQHYLLLTKTEFCPSPATLRLGVEYLTDIRFRRMKRERIAGVELPALNYHVNFIQDWPFVRSLMDAWPAGRLRATLRKDIIAEPYLHLLEGFLDRTACPFASISTVSEGISAMEGWGGLDQPLVMTATEGLLSMTHLMGSLLLLEARKRGARTLCLQHGMSIPRDFKPAAAVTGAWDEGSAKELRSLLTANVGSDVRCTGSPKFLDALLPPSAGALGHRLGQWTRNYTRSILIGLNLHWAVHVHGSRETYDWLRRLAAQNPGTLFLLRPHPDDASSFEMQSEEFSENVMIVDELLLLCIDWPVARLLRSISGVLTTYSTLALDAAAAGKPVVLLPYRAGHAQVTSAMLPVSAPWGPMGCPVLSDEDWRLGRLPHELRGPCSNPADYKRAYFDPSWLSIERIAAIGRDPHPATWELAQKNVGEALAAAAAWHNLDMNPHVDRERVARAIRSFASLREHV